MSDAWAIVTAGLGGSVVTGGLAVALEAVRVRADRIARIQADRKAAYSDLLAASGMVIDWAGAMHVTMELRSGLKEGMDVTFGHRKLLDALDIMQSRSPVSVALFKAWSAAWVVASADGIRCANDVVDAAQGALGAATTRGEARGRVDRTIRGEAWTPKQLEDWSRAIERVAQARRSLALLARKEIGVEVAEVFTVGGRPREDSAANDAAIHRQTHD
jgi:hypothetical protein